MAKKKPDWERFGRASKAEAPEITELNAWRKNPRSFDVASYYCQALIHRAHVVMLTERGIIGVEEARTLIPGIRKVEKMAADDPSLVGYMSTETALIKLIGEGGGRMHIGRSRNDLGHTQRRMYFRDQEERLAGSLIHFQEKLLAKAEENAETLMPGYTHMRQAQPATLGHYLLAHVDAADRSLGRVEDAYRRTNLSPLGSAAFAGTGWPVDRTRTKELLGFDGLLENSTDAVASIDYVMEFASAIAIHLSSVSRLAEDLQVWSDDEHGMIDLDEAYAGTSSIMPQKKNPLILEYLKGYASESIGNLVSVVVSVKGSAYTNMVDRILLEPVAIDTAVGATNVIAGLVASMTPVSEAMERNLREGFSTTTDLADALVRLHKIGFRQAHDTVVDVVLKAISQGKKVSEVTPDMVADSSLNVVGRRLEIGPEDLRAAVDPAENLRRKTSIGGPAPDEVRRMIAERRSRLADTKRRREGRLGKLRAAYEKLAEVERGLGVPVG